MAPLNILLYIACLPRKWGTDIPFNLIALTWDNSHADIGTKLYKESTQRQARDQIHKQAHRHHPWHSIKLAMTSHVCTNQLVQRWSNYDRDISRMSQMMVREKSDASGQKTGSGKRTWCHGWWSVRNPKLQGRKPVPGNARSTGCA